MRAVANQPYPSSLHVTYIPREVRLSDGTQRATAERMPRYAPHAAYQQPGYQEKQNQMAFYRREAP